MDIISDLNFLLKLCTYSFGSVQQHHPMIHETILHSLNTYYNNQIECKTDEEIEKHDLLIKCREMLSSQDNNLDITPRLLKRCIEEHFKFYNINF